MKNLLLILLLAIVLIPGFQPKPAQGAPVAQAKTAPGGTELEVNDAKRARVIPIRVYLPAQTAATPVVLFSHGLGGTREAATYLGKYWAAHGYVAVFMQHAGSDEGVWKDVAPRQRMAALRKAGNLDNFLLRVGDVAAVLDQLEIWDTQTGNPLAGRLDMNKIGMAGHSFGAVTTQAVSGQTSALGADFTDKRIKAALVLSPSAPANGNAKSAFGTVKIPWLLMTGTKDNAIVAATRATDRTLVYGALPRGEKYQLIFDKAEHSAFVDERLKGNALPRNPNHHRAIEEISTAFWNAYLKGDAKAKKWIDGDAVRDVLEAADVWQTK